MHDAAVAAGMPRGCIVLVDSADRDGADELMQLHGIVDVLVPRGGAGLIRHCVEHAKVPVIETGTGNCHVYVHESADASMARAIVLNAKCRRFGVCNAAGRCWWTAPPPAASCRRRWWPLRARAWRCTATTRRFAVRSGPRARAGRTGVELRFDHATEEDWATEYLAPELAVRVVDGVDEAIAHVNRYGTRHSEAIVADPATPDGAAAIEAFLARVDAAAVYANASTAFTDGGSSGWARK